MVGLSHLLPKNSQRDNVLLLAWSTVSTIKSKCKLIEYKRILKFIHSF